MLSSRQNTLKTIGKEIRSAREAKGISQDQLAAEAGLHRAYIGGVERGERNITILNLIKLAKALGVSTRSLLPPKL